MSTLDTKYYKKQARIFILITSFVFIFSFVYELFSHNVYSKYMVFSPLIPFMLGTFIYYILYFIKPKIKLTNINYNIHNSLILTLTLGSILKGILEIYGTTNKLIKLYLYISIFLVILNIICIIKNNIEK